MNHDWENLKGLVEEIGGWSLNMGLKGGKNNETEEEEGEENFSEAPISDDMSNWDLKKRLSTLNIKYGLGILYKWSVSTTINSSLYTISVGTAHEQGISQTLSGNP